MLQRGAARIARCHWAQRIAKPIADRYPAVLAAYEGASASVPPGVLGNKAQYHEGVSGAT